MDKNHCNPMSKAPYSDDGNLSKKVLHKLFLSLSFVVVVVVAQNEINQQQPHNNAQTTI